MRGSGVRVPPPAPVKQAFSQQPPFRPKRRKRTVSAASRLCPRTVPIDRRAQLEATDPAADLAARMSTDERFVAVSRLYHRHEVEARPSLALRAVRRELVATLVHRPGGI